MSKCTYTINGTEYDSYRKALEEAIQSAQDKNQPIILYSKPKKLNIDSLTNIIKKNNDLFEKSKGNKEKSIGVTTLISGKHESPEDPIENLIRTYSLQAGIEKHKYIQGLIQNDTTLQEEAIKGRKLDYKIIGGLEGIQKSINGFKSWLEKIETSDEKFTYHVDGKSTITIEKKQFLKEDKSIDKDAIGRVLNQLQGLLFAKEDLDSFKRNITIAEIFSTLGIKVKDVKKQALSELELIIASKDLNKKTQELLRNIAAKDVNISQLKGVIDLLVIDNDGKIHIIDVKTHKDNSPLSDKADEAHFKQLQAYSDMLQFILSDKYQDKIDIIVLDINMVLENQGGEDYATSKLSARKQSLRSNSDNHIIDIKKLTTEEQEHVIHKIESLNGSLLNRSKSKKESLITYLENKYKKNKLGWKCAYYEYNSEPCIVKLSDTNIDSTTKERQIPDEIFLVSSRDESKVIRKIPREEFFENEASTLLNNRYNRYEDFQNILSNILDTTTEFSEEHDRKSSFEGLIWGRGEQHKRHIYRNIIKYTYGWYSIEDNQPLLQQGIIVLHDRANNVYDFLVLDSMDREDYKDYNTPVQASKGSTVLGEILTDEQVEKYNVQKIENTVGNQLMMTSIATISAAMDSLQSKGAKIGDIKIINTQTGITYHKTNTYEEFKQYLKILADADSSFENLSEDADNLSFQSHGTTVLQELSYYAISELNIEELYKLDLKDKYLIIQELKSRKKAFEDAYKDHLSRDKSTQSDEDNQYTRVKQLLDDLILYLEYGQISPNKVSKRGLDSKEAFGIPFDIFKKGKISKYTASGYTLCGFAQGYYYATAFNNPDNAVHATNQLIMNVISKLRIDAQESNRELFEATDKFLDEKTNWLKSVTLGNTESVYKSLFKRNKQGEISSELLLLNPYEDAMSATDKEYLEVVLWYLNRTKWDGLEDEERSMTYKQFKKSKKFETYKNAVKLNSNLRYYPLMISRHANKIMPDRKTFKQHFYDNINRWSTYINPQHLTDKDLKKLNKSLQDLEMYTQYSDTDRERVLNETPISSFEFNVERAVAEYSFSQIKKTYYDKTLSQIDCIIGFLMQYSAQTGEDVTETIKTIQERIRIALFSHNIADQDLNEVNKIVSSLKSLSSLVKIGARPLLFLKEMTVSALKIFGQCSFGFFEGGTLTIKDITKGYKHAFSFKDGNPENSIFDLASMNKVSALNRHFGIADMDINKTILKTIRDRFGLHNTLEQMMYWSQTQPDYFHRCAIFIACMEKDGCYSAYSLKDGILTYDMAKDERFKLFWKLKSDTSNKPEEYYKQEALYQAYLDDFNKAGYTLKYGDKLPDCYPPSKRNSIVEQINTTLGAFDHELAANFQKSQYAIYFMQFKTYLASMMKFCFATRNGNTCVGDFQFKKDEFGNYLYIQGIDPNTGEYIYTTEKYDEEGNRLKGAMDFELRGMEGIFISFLKTAYDIINPNSSFREKLKSDKWEDKQQIANTKVLLFYIFIAAALGSIGRLIAMLIEKSNKNQDTDEVEKALASEILKFNQRVGSEFNFWNSLAEPVLDMNIVGIDVLEKSLNSTVDVITGDKHASRLFFDNVAALKDTHIPDIMGWN